MSKTLGMRWLVVAAGAAMLLVLGAACTKEVEVPGETIIVEKEVVKTVEVPGETIVVEKEVIKTVEVEVPGKTVTVTKEVIKEVEVPGETVVVTKEVIKEVEVPGETVVVTKEVLKVVEVRQRYVTDPSTGKVVSAPEYGGTITFARNAPAVDADVLNVGSSAALVDPVLEKLAIADWTGSRDKFDFQAYVLSPPANTKGSLAESWSQPDPLTLIIKVRQGVHWHKKSPMNGRALTAQDIEYNYHRILGLGSGFTEPSEATTVGFKWPGVKLESVTATDESTVVFKLQEPSLTFLDAILNERSGFIYPPEVIKEHGDARDWRNLVGTGPMMLTEWVEGSSITWEKNPDYWGYDEKYPQNRLPYVDEIRGLIMPEVATYLAALRSGKLDYVGQGLGKISTIDQAESLQRTNPEIVLYNQSSRSSEAIAPNVRVPPFDDIRVRKAMQMALDLEAITATYFKGQASATPQGMVEAKRYSIPFKEWPEEVKKGYMYDPEGAKKLLAEAGYPNGFKTKYEFSSENPAWTNLDYSQLAVAYWAEIGVDVEIDILERTASWF